MVGNRVCNENQSAEAKTKTLSLTTPHSSDRVAVPIGESVAERKQLRGKSCQPHVLTM